MKPFPALYRLLAWRPIQKALRYVYRYTHPRELRHNQALWPLVQVRRDAAHRIVQCTIRGTSYSPAVIDLNTEPLKTGGTCHLILSGPSVARIDYNQLDLEHVMGVNGSIALQERYPGLKFDYYAILDTGFMSRRRALVERILSQDLLLLATPEVVRWIALHVPAERVNCRIAVFEEVHARAMLPRPTPETLAAQLENDPDLVLFDARHPRHAHGFSLDLPRGAFGGGTVAYTALQLLYWLEFSTIYLHGLDLKDAGAQPRFYETGKDKLGTSLDRQFTDHIEPSFRKAAALLREQGVKVYNLSLDSALGEDIFPKIDWHTLAVSAATPPRSSSDA